MSCITNNCVTRCFQRGLNQANEAISKSENLEKVAKVTFKTIDFVSLLTGKVVTAFKLFSSRLKETADVLELFCFVGRFKELACPDNKGQYFLQKSTWQKCADRIFLTTASVFKTINMAAKFTFISLGKAAKFAFGKVPVLKLIPDSLVMVSSFFNIWDNKNITKEKSGKLANACSKIEKWSNRPALIAAVRSEDPKAVSNLKNHYEMQSSRLEQEIRCLEAAGKDIAKKTVVLNKYKDRLNLIAQNNCAELANELDKQDIAFKHKYWSTEHGNQKIGQNKAWLGIASSASKIFVITMATTGTALGLSTAPWVLSLLAVGIAVDSIGLTKSLYEHSSEIKNLPKKAIAV